MQVYSDFFTSGLSNISESNNIPNQSYHSSTSSHTMIPYIQNMLILSLSTWSRKSGLDNAKRHKCVSSSLPRPSKKWFGNISRRGFSRLQQEGPINDGPVENEHNNVQDPQVETLDPFSSSLDSTSYFIDKLGIHDETLVHRAHMPITQLSIHPLSHSTSRCFEYREVRECPISIQTSPSFQLASRRSSLQQWSVSSEKSDSFSMCMWRDDGPLSPSFPLEKDDPADIDWREFHDSILYNANMVEEL